MFDNALLHTIVPNVFFVASRSWGIELVALILIPLSLSCIVLAAGAVTAASVWRREGRGTALASLVWGAFLITLGAAVSRWFFVVRSAESASLWLLSLAVEVGGIVAIWVLLLMRSRARSFTIGGYALFALVCTAAGAWVLFGISSNASGMYPRAFIAESLLALSAGISTVFVRYHFPNTSSAPGAVGKKTVMRIETPPATAGTLPAKKKPDVPPHGTVQTPSS